MFLRICPYFPFNARVCVNQRECLARQFDAEGILFRKASNAFLQCSDPERLQQLADGLTPADLEIPIQRWLRELVRFHASSDPNQIVDCVYRLFCSQVEYLHQPHFQRAGGSRSCGRAHGARQMPAPSRPVENPCVQRHRGNPSRLTTCLRHTILEMTMCLARITEGFDKLR
jgi:hypothetical protein